MLLTAELPKQKERKGVEVKVTTEQGKEAVKEGDLLGGGQSEQFAEYLEYAGYLLKDGRWITYKKKMRERMIENAHECEL